MAASNVNVSSDDIRATFASALSEMYRSEVPQYGTLLELVSEINLNEQRDQALSQDTRHRMEVERHGAIRLGTAAELSIIRRLFSIMDMHPVGYYDLTVAGLPVHATCFRPLTIEALAHNHFRVFTSLLRLDLIHDNKLRSLAEEVLRKRQIFTRRCIELIGGLESQQSIPKAKADELLQEALKTFRWHETSTVDLETFKSLQAAHPLIADVVCFRGPHINHLTPRVLDIEAAQVEMQRRGLRAKDRIEGPPPRRFPILLRQTSFLALEEDIAFSDGAEKGGRHKARFGEIEQRGMALTPKGRLLYDQLVSKSVQKRTEQTSNQENLVNIFREFLDDLETLRREELAYFSYEVAGQTGVNLANVGDVETLVEAGVLDYKPVTYEDFLPVSAAGIFHSNLGTNVLKTETASDGQDAFEKGLGCAVRDSFHLYRDMEQQSITDCLNKLGRFSKGRTVSK